MDVTKMTSLSKRCANICDNRDKAIGSTFDRDIDKENKKVQDNEMEAPPQALPVPDIPPDIPPDIGEDVCIFLVFT